MTKQPYQIRVMTTGDLPHCQQLRQQTMWNQTLADWQRFVSLSPNGCFVVTDQDKIIGTACTVAYQSFGWIAMVIVDEAYRRKGIGRMLLTEGIQYLESRGLTVKLDATPDGKMLYDTLGFVDEYNAARYECFGIEIEPQTLDNIISISQDNLAKIVHFDADAFGEERSHVLQGYVKHYPESALCVIEEGEVKGYIMGREGDRAFHIGPWVSHSKETAEILFLALLNKRKPENVFVDVVEPNEHVMSIINNFHFELQRPFIRMYKGNNLRPGKPHLIYGMSGPELG